MELNNIYNLDFKVLTKKMIKENIFVDLVITDPPYNVSRKHQLGFSNMGRAGMDFGEWDYDFDQKKWISMVSKVIKPGGSFVIFNDWKNSSLICAELEKNGFEIKDLIRARKSNPMPRNVDRRYVSDCEFAIWAVKPGGKWTFNKPKDKPYLKPEFTDSVVPGGKGRIHPTQKNLNLGREIIKIHSNENDLVFDPFSGSGSFSIAAYKERRNFIASEVNPDFYDKSCQRLIKENERK